MWWRKKIWKQKRRKEKRWEKALLKKITAFIISIGLFVASGPIIFSNNSSDDKIHFLPTKSGDAILLESNGKFALVDGAEDSDNPRGFKSLAGAGHEKEVVNYIKKVAGDKNGKVTLEFVVGTHAHSDHLGGLDTVVRDKDIHVKRGYLKVYDESKIKVSEVNDWDNKQVYDQLIKALKDEKAIIIQDIPTKAFMFGDLTIQFYNTTRTSNKRVGENENSLGLLVSKNNQKVFLAGDMNNLDGDEDRVAKQIGKVDVLKVGHHGYDGSSTQEFLNKLKPTYSIVTNYDTLMNHKVVKRLNDVKTKVYPTMLNNGVVITFGKADFGLSKYKQIRQWTYENGWVYKNPQGDYAKGWAQLNWNGKVDWYFFDNNGKMKSGWIFNGGKWYYLNEKSDSKGYYGTMLTGWQQVKYCNKTDRYYFDKSGAMKTGWIQLGGKWYYLNEKSDSKGYCGAMLTGTHKLMRNGKWGTFTFNKSGQLIN
jgi:beta-lactamase superfamily II metal-dependent hydrolase